MRMITLLWGCWEKFGKFNCMESEVKLSKEQLKKLFRSLLRFPYPQICRHLVIMDILSLIEENGVAPNKDFTRAVCKSDDYTAFELLEKVWEDPHF